MGMWASSDFFKRSLNYLTSQVKIISVCSTRPADSTEALKTGGGICMARSSSGASCVSAPGSTTNGWTVATTAITSIAVSSSGKADHIALLGSTALLLYVTTCTAKNLTTSDTVTIPSFNIRIADPTSS